MMPHTRKYSHLPFELIEMIRRSEFTARRERDLGSSKHLDCYSIATPRRAEDLPEAAVTDNFANLNVIEVYLPPVLTFVVDQVF